MRKLRIILLVALCFSLCLILSSCFGGDESLNYLYEYDELSQGYFVKINPASKNERKLVIPSTYDGLPVTGIAKEGFAHMYNLKSVEIPEGVKFIDESAFQYCSKLKEVTIPSSVVHIGDCAFSSCDRLKTVSIYTGQASIGDYAFSLCYKLKEVYIADGVSKIGTRAFNECVKLRKIRVPNSVTAVGEEAFKNCDKLKGKKGHNAYYIGNEENPYLILLRADSKNIFSCRIKENTRIICDRAFANCTKLKKVEIPDTVRSVGVDAFLECTKLQYVTDGVGKYLGNKSSPNLVFIKANNGIGACKLKNGTKIIADGAFKDSTLTAIEMPQGLTSIGQKAFEYCKNLENVVIPNSIERVGENAFDLTFNLKHNSYKGGNYLGNSENPFLVLAYVNYYEYYFVTHPSTKIILESAFYGNENTESVLISDSVTSINSNTFKSCPNVTIYCEALAKPDGWACDWNGSGLDNVIWGKNN